jgi:hypothetical protein
MYKPTHTGLKNIKATAMTRGAYNEYREWTLPANELGSDEGYLIEYEPRPGESSNLEEKGHVGYVSWTPKLVFDEAYHHVQGSLPFGLAIELAKQGFAIARRDWYGSGFQVRMQQPSLGSNMTQCYLYLQYPATLAAGNGYNTVPWTPLQADIFSSDWHAVE